jgi:ribosomal protein S12 methylthiotransferase
LFDNPEPCIAAVSLGCAKNRVDTEEILGLLSRCGYRLTPSTRQADIIIINTCAFIDRAKEESINTILKMAEVCRKNNAKLVVIGCLAQRYGRKLMQLIPEVDVLAGVHSYAALPALLGRCRDGGKTFLLAPPAERYSSLGERVLTTAPHSTFVKIAEGCNNRCRYCRIPGIRGPYRSRTAAEIIEEVKRLASGGVKEINLVAQDTTLYGKDLYGAGDHLASLLKKLAAIESLSWIRLLYLYPNRITDQLIELIAAEDKICSYLDIPLQHISDRVLSRMGRLYRRAQVEELLEKLRRRIPGLALRTTFMVGYPGETTADFMELLDFVRVYPFERLGAFSFSSQSGTPAAGMPGQVPARVKEARRRRLMELQLSISRRLNRRLLGTVQTVMVEGEAGPNRFRGRLYSQAPAVDGEVYFYALERRRMAPGDLVPIQIRASGAYNVSGYLVINKGGLKGWN